MCVGASTYVLDESALVLEGVTLGEVVELVVEVLVDLAAGTVLDEEAAEDTLTAHPEDLTVKLVRTSRLGNIRVPSQSTGSKAGCEDRRLAGKQTRGTSHCLDQPRQRLHPLQP